MKSIWTFLKIFFFLIVSASHAYGEWVKPNSTTAQTNPSPYNNNEDYSTTLSIPNATRIQVTIRGDIEAESQCRFDYLETTDSGGNPVGNGKYCGGSIDDTFFLDDSRIRLMFHSDDSVTDSGVTVTIEDATPAGPPANIRQFSQRYLTNIKGNIRVIGNTVLQSLDGYSTYNSHVRLSYTDVDSDGTTFNSSSASIEGTYADVNITDAKILWAGLYWQGYLHSDDNDTGLDTHYNIDNNTSANTQIQNLITSQQILLKKGNGGYMTITPQVINWDREYNWTNYVAYKYGAFADVTSLIKNLSPSDTYTIANIPTREGRTNSGNSWDGLGNYGAWTLVIIYDNGSIPAEKIRNISVFDGYLVLNNTTTQIDIPVGGFKTPTDPEAEVDSTLSVFAGEGDRNITGDYLHLINQAGDEYNLSSSGGATNFFNSSIEGVGHRSPSLTNNMGIDIHTQQVGTKGGDDKPIKPNQTSATLRIGTNGDHFVPQLISLATELYVPKICYDYNIKQDGFDITEDNRTIHTIGGGKLSLNFGVKSEEGDFDFENSVLSVTLDPPEDIDFDNAFYSPNTVNTLIPAIEANGSTSSEPKIALGENATPSGGTMKALERYFGQFNYDLTANQYQGRFDTALNMSIDFGSGPVPYRMSTQDGTLPRCDQIEGYHPLYGSFNVERHGSSGSPSEKYPLYTQVVGKDFDFDVVAYTHPPSYDTELSLNNYTVALELINAKSFQDENGTFLCNNTDPFIIQSLTASGDKEILAKFSGSSRVDLSSYDISLSRALRSAAFRVWYIVDKNNTIVQHTCTDTSDNACFQAVYDQHIRSDDTALQPSGTHGFCTVETLGGNGCSDYTNPTTGASGCYGCLRDHFSRAVCSRDNFAIRPASYRLSISDSNESITPPSSITLADNTVPGTDSVATLAAGYRYKLDGNATSYEGADVIARGYRRIFDNRKIDNLSSLLLFKDKPVCFDKNDTKWGTIFIDGRITGIANNNDVNLSSGNLVKHSNAGKYAYRLYDSNWTLVDQQRYPHKTFPGINDCIPDRNSIATDSLSKSGCNIDSKLLANTGEGAPIYNDLYLQFQPYSFDVGSVVLDLRPETTNGFLFMNDMNNSNYYGDLSVQQIDMAAVYHGSVIARGKMGTQLTNFTDSCAASNVRINLGMGDFNGTMQEYLQHTKSTNPIYDKKESVNNQPVNLTLPKVAFADANQSGFIPPPDTNGSDTNDTNRSFGPGSAKLWVYTTIKKPTKGELQADGRDGENPKRIHYVDLNATGDSAHSMADMGVHVPKGPQGYDINATFLYARITPESFYYPDVEDSSKKTPLYTNVYCEDTPDVNCSDLGVVSPGKGLNGSNNWHLANMFNAAADIGAIDMCVKTMEGVFAEPGVAAPNIPNSTAIQGVTFGTPNVAEQAEVLISVNGPGRPSVIKVYYSLCPPTLGPPTLTPPWLIYGDAEQSFYRVKFIGPRNWSGVGKTGQVTDTTSSTSTKHRMNW